jgi:hypothetical protein
MPHTFRTRLPCAEVAAGVIRAQRLSTYCCHVMCISPLPCYATCTTDSPHPVMSLYICASLGCQARTAKASRALLPTQLLPTHRPSCRFKVVEQLPHDVELRNYEPGGQQHTACCRAAGKWALHGCCSLPGALHGCCSLPAWQAVNSAPTLECLKRACPRPSCSPAAVWLSCTV